MVIQRAKVSRTSFKTALERNVAKERELKALTKTLEEDRLRRAKALRLAKAADSRFRNQLRRRLILEAAKGSKFLVLGDQELRVSGELEYLGFNIVSIESLKNRVESAIRSIAETRDQQIMAYPEKAVLPLRKFLMISMLREWRSRQNDLKELESLADLLLEGLVRDLKGSDVSKVRQRLELLSSLDSDDRHSELTLGDFLDVTEFTEVQRKAKRDMLDIYIEVERESELFTVLDTLTRSIHRAMTQVKVDRETTADARAELVALSDDLDACQRGVQIACWWGIDGWSPVSPPSSLAAQLEWLSSPEGNRLLEDIGAQIDTLSKRGEASEISISFGSKDTNLYASDIVIEYLKGLGYRCKLKSRKKSDPLEYLTSW